jgi:hypothetical protein
LLTVLVSLMDAWVSASRSSSTSAKSWPMIAQRSSDPGRAGPGRGVDFGGLRAGFVAPAGLVAGLVAGLADALALEAGAVAFFRVAVAAAALRPVCVKPDALPGLDGFVDRLDGMDFPETSGEHQIATVKVAHQSIPVPVVLERVDAERHAPGTRIIDLVEQANDAAREPHPTA